MLKRKTIANLALNGGACAHSPVKNRTLAKGPQACGTQTSKSLKKWLIRHFRFVSSSASSPAAWLRGHQRGRDRRAPR
jgi:hypothetical protein